MLVDKFFRLFCLQRINDISEVFERTPVFSNIIISYTHIRSDFSIDENYVINL